MQGMLLGWKRSVLGPVSWLVVAGVWPIPAATLAAEEAFTPQHVARLRSVTAARISPDGAHVAYVLSVPRTPGKGDDGPAWAELHVVDRQGHSRPFITGEVNVGAIDWTPDGKSISFVAKRGKDKNRSLYIIPLDGGEARKLRDHDTDIGDYSWSPDGGRVAFLAKEKEPKQRKDKEDKGFKQIIYEEGLRPTSVWIASATDDAAKPRMMELVGSASAVRWSPTGARIALALAPTPLIDDQYMKNKLYVYDVDSGALVSSFQNPGKLGPFTWSPDGEHLAAISAEDIHDPSAGRLMVAGLADGSLRDVLPNYEGQVAAAWWQDADTIMYLGDEGVWTTLGEVGRSGTERKTHTPTGRGVYGRMSLSRDGQCAAMISSAPTHPSEVYYLCHGDAGPRRLTDSNTWLSRMRFARQEVVSHVARDGLRLEGILIRPLDEVAGQRYPLILCVHGGPESHDRNEWLTGYADPGQVAAAQGFAVFYPNYRGSTGRGVAFSKLGQADYAGKEFDDLVDAVDHLVSTGLVDKDRVGITGGSYGGYATAWCSTYYSERFAAGVMFVGVSNLISKYGTTDIPNEMHLVHSRKKLWEDWNFFLERSPLYHIEKARTPLLIMHGKDDPRVDAGQSMELYRQLKLLGETPVRLVLYPGEGHGNRKAAARLDYNLRMMRWFTHYLQGPGGAPPEPEMDYGIESDKEESADADVDDKAKLADRP